MAQFVFSVNEQRSTVDVDPDTPLLYVSTNDLGLRGARFGCGLARCSGLTFRRMAPQWRRSN